MTEGLPKALIEEALRTPKSGREPDELERLLAARPKEGPFAAGGLVSWTAALAHPTLGPLLESLPDRLYWSRGKPEEIDAEGIELCLLAHAFAMAGHPIRAMPPIRQFAESVLNFCRVRRNHAVLAAWRGVKGIYRDYFSPLTAAPTLRALDVLAANLIPTTKQILRAKRKYVPAEISDADLDAFFERETARAVRAAMQFDPAKDTEFSTYVYKYIEGAARDWRADYFGFNPKTGERFASRADDVPLSAPTGRLEDDKPLTIGDSLVDESTEWHPEDELPTLAERVSDPRLSTGDRAFIAGLIAHGGRLADYAHAIGKEPAAVRQHARRIRNKL